MFSEDEKRKLLSDMERLLENDKEIRAWQERQDEKINSCESGVEKLNRAMFDNDENEGTGGGVRTKTNYVYNTMQELQHQFKGGRIVVAGLLMLGGSGVTFIVNLLTGGG